MELSLPSLQLEGLLWPLHLVCPFTRVIRFLIWWLQASQSECSKRGYLRTSFLTARSRIAKHHPCKVRTQIFPFKKTPVKLDEWLIIFQYDFILNHLQHILRYWGGVDFNLCILGTHNSTHSKACSDLICERHLLALQSSQLSGCAQKPCGIRSSICFNILEMCLWRWLFVIHEPHWITCLGS